MVTELHLLNKQASAQPQTEKPDAQPLKFRKSFRANRLLRWYLATDGLAMVIGLLCASAISASVNALFFKRTILNSLAGHDAMQVAEFLLIGAGVLLWFHHTDHYRMRMPFWLEIKKVVCALSFALMADGFLQFLSRQDYSRLWLMSGWLVACAAIIGLRVAMRGWLRRSGRFQLSTLLIGSGETARHTRAALRSEPGLGYDVTVQIKNLPLAFMQEGRSWQNLCTAYGADYVIIALDGPDLAAAEQPLAQLMRESIPFSVSPPLRHLPVQGLVPQYVFNHDTMLLTRSNGLEQPLPRFLKRAVDVLVSGGALLALSPLMLLLACMVKCDGGNVFYGHMRLGKNGKAFPCLKFRSMVNGGDAVLQRYLEAHPEAQTEWEATRKLQNDPRITRVGAFLRGTSLDELPQLFNVLRGEMSLVGPRPIVTAEIANYDCDIAHYYRVRPGITGLWQVSGRSDVTYAQRVQMDSWYVRNWSLWHDIAILCKTFPAVLKRQGAY